MNKIALPATDSTPGITLDPVSFIFEIKGESSPEDARKFYQPLIQWVDDYGKHLHFVCNDYPEMKNKELIFTFHLNYVTSSSLKNIYDFLQHLQQLTAYTKNLKVQWIYDKGDDDMEENGKEFSAMIKIPFIIKSA